MTKPQAIADLISQTKELMRDKLGVRASDMARAAAKAKNRLPAKVYKQAMLLAKAETLSRHPKLCLTLDAPALGLAASDVQDYLSTINLKDQRKGWILGMLGGLAFNMILFVVVLGLVLYWRGFF